MKSTVVLSPLTSPRVAYEPILEAQTWGHRGHWSVAVAVAEGWSVTFPRPLSPIMCSLRLDSKLVQALVMRERHSVLSNARASSSPGGMPRCLRRSLIKSLNCLSG